MRIVVTGPAVSGRQETLRRLAELSDPPIAPQPIYPRRHGFDLVFGSAAVSVRGILLGPHYVDVDAPPTDETTREDFAFVQRADVAIIVVDSQPERMDANVDHVRTFSRLLALVGRWPVDLPVVFQLNKQDLHPLDEDAVSSVLAWPRCVYCRTVAKTGEGVRELLSAALALRKLRGSDPFTCT